MIDNIHNDLKPFACIMTERFENIQKDQSNYYIREETKKSQKDTTENKADETLTSLRRDGQSKEDKQK